WRHASPTERPQRSRSALSGKQEVGHHRRAHQSEGDHDRQRRTARRPPGHTGETPAARPVLDDAEDRDEYAGRDQRRADPERYTGRPSGGRAHRWLERTQEQPEASDHEAQAEERDRRPAPGKEGLLDREPGPAGISLGVA